MSEETARIDVWLWRARFCKTRALAARFVEAGQVRLSRNGQLTRLDKASRSVRPGDTLIFVLSERVFNLRIEALGQRRGPPPVAQGLYSHSAPDKPA